MRAVSLCITLLLLAVPRPLVSQLSDATLRMALTRADQDPNPVHLIEATDAARLMRDYETAAGYLGRAWEAGRGLINDLISSTLMYQLASGDGVEGVQRAFREIRGTVNLSPIEIANWGSNFPEIFASGELDQMVLRMSADAEDPQYRCGCYNAIAWVHRLAGREDEARRVWAIGLPDLLASVNAAGHPDAQAQLRGQYARNLARVGRDDEAREQLRLSMSAEVSPGALPEVRRRWAQAYAELGDARGAVEQLEALLGANTLITVHTLDSRAAWGGIRDHPEFRAMLERHR